FRRIETAGGRTLLGLLNMNATETVKRDAAVYGGVCAIKSERGLDSVRTDVRKICCEGGGVGHRSGTPEIGVIVSRGGCLSVFVRGGGEHAAGAVVGSRAREPGIGNGQGDTGREGVAAGWCSIGVVIGDLRAVH